MRSGSVHKQRCHMQVRQYRVPLHQERNNWRPDWQHCRGRGEGDTEAADWPMSLCGQSVRKDSVLCSMYLLLLYGVPEKQIDRHKGQKHMYTVHRQTDKHVDRKKQPHAPPPPPPPSFCPWFYFPHCHREELASTQTLLLPELSFLFSCIFVEVLYATAPKYRTVRSKRHYIKLYFNMAKYYRFPSEPYALSYCFILFRSCSKVITCIILRVK